MSHDHTHDAETDEIVAMLEQAGLELDAEAESSDGTVIVTTVKDGDAPLGEETMSITITIKD